MKFQFVMMTINNLQIPMIRVEGEHYITQKSLEKLLGVDGGTLRKTFKNRRDEFDGLSVDSIYANDFIKEHKELLGVKRVRRDMHLWSEHDMLTFTMIVRGPRGKELRSELIQFIKDNAKYETVPQAEHDKALSRLDQVERELERLRGDMEMLKPLLKEQARLSGKSLRMQRETKHLRDRN